MEDKLVFKKKYRTGIYIYSKPCSYLSFSYVNFIEIILNHLVTIMKFNWMLPHVNYLNDGWVCCTISSYIRFVRCVGPNFNALWKKNFKVRWDGPKLNRLWKKNFKVQMWQNNQRPCKQRPKLLSPSPIVLISKVNLKGECDNIHLINQLDDTEKMPRVMAV